MRYLDQLADKLQRHPDLFPEAAVRDILAPLSIATKLAALFRYAGDRDIPLYVLIDEYDNFANTVLAYHGPEAYHSFTHGGGFYRNFFATLKGGADRTGGGLDRLFINSPSYRMRTGNRRSSPGVAVNGRGRGVDPGRGRAGAPGCGVGGR